MARIYTKIGDIFSVKLNDNSKKYFQLITYDLTQLNSDVIRAFKKVYPLDVTPDLLGVVSDDVEFYAHCVTKWGVKLGFWEKVGNISKVGELSHILFRGTSDYGCKAGEDPIRVSHNWYVWRINDANFTRVGKLSGENQKAEIGIVMDPESIVHRMRTGEYDGYYPDY